MKKIVVLGAGLVGKAIAIDLNKNHDVTSIDKNPDSLRILNEQGIRTKQIDLSRGDNIREEVRDFDLVIGAIPGFMGYHTMKNVITAGKNMVDISFMPQDPADMDDLAKEKGLTLVTDCGVAPGMGNIILGFHNKAMEVQRFECLVGGLPVVREWP